MLQSRREETSLLRDLAADARRFVRWCRGNPLHALLCAGLVATIVYVFLGPRIYQGVTLVTWLSWRYEPEYNHEHGKLVPLIFLGLVWYHRKALRDAPKSGDNWGLLIVLLGCLFFLGGARTLQARIALFAFPVIIWGSVLFLWGRKTARIMLFPCVFLIFAIPVAALEQATFRLQFLITGTATAVCNFIGIPLYAVGTTLKPLDDSFGFDIAEGCSGIRSLMAMMMLTAIYVHLTQDRLWKKGLIFCFATAFAIIGNAGRIVTILLVAKFIDPGLAGGLYHDYSPFVFFPIALGAMVLFSKLINANYARLAPANLPHRKDAPTYDY